MMSGTQMGHTGLLSRQKTQGDPASGISEVQHICDPQGMPTWTPRQLKETSTFQPEAKPVETVETLLV